MKSLSELIFSEGNRGEIIVSGVQGESSLTRGHFWVTSPAAELILSLALSLSLSLFSGKFNNKALMNT